MSIDTVDDLIILRRKVEEGYQPSLDELRSAATFVRAQRGAKPRETKAKAKVVKEGQPPKTLLDMFNI